MFNMHDKEKKKTVALILNKEQLVMLKRSLYLTEAYGRDYGWGEEGQEEL